MSRLLFPLVCMLLLATQSAAQPEKPEPRIRYGSRLYLEMASGPSDSVGLARVDMLLRVSYDFMIFERDAAAQADSAFRGGVDVSINLKKDGVFIGSLNLGANIATAAYDETDRRDQYLLLQKTMYLAPGSYDGVVVVSDRRSEREQMLTRSFRALRFDEATLGRPVAMEVTDASTQGIRALGFSGFLPFASKTLLAFPASDEARGAWHFLLERRGRSREVVFDGNIQPVRSLQHVSLRHANGAVNRFDLEPCEGCVGQLVLFELPFDSVDVGAYSLRVSTQRNGVPDTLTVDTEVFWRDMPYSLNDINVAIDAMHHILTKEQLDVMKDGDEAYQRQQFRRYWEERDPTPGTAYNELMTEYFRRVDQAWLKFRTLYEPDGVTTDRGKVYILFGPPEDTKRVLNSGEPAMEEWYYPSLSKTFRFVDSQRNGNMRLMEE